MIITQRVVEAIKDAVAGYSIGVAEAVGGAVFSAGGNATSGKGESGMVVVGHIDTCSTSRRNLMPLAGECHMGYVPCGGRVLGLSKLARLAEVHAKRLQEPVELAENLAQAVQEAAEPLGVSVRVRLQELTPGGSEPEEHEVHLGCTASSKSRQEEFDRLLALQRPGKSRPWHPWGGEGSEEGNLVRVDGVQRAAQWERMRSAASKLLQRLNVPLGEEERERAAKGYVRALLEATSGHELSARKLIASDAIRREDRGTLSGRLTVDVVPIRSTCEHHLLPFVGEARIAYPEEAEDVLPQGALRSLAECRAKRLQVQERLAEEVAEGVQAACCSQLGMAGPGVDVVVAVEACHLCMVARGVRKAASRTSSVACLGSPRSDPAARASALSLLLPME